MPYQTISQVRQLEDFCRTLADCEWIALDTEFVAEQTYRPVLCLVQVATPRGLALIDAVALGDVAPFWEAVAVAGRATIVHAGRAELEFCLRTVGRRMTGLFDVQIAAGLVGMEYPAGFRNLIARLLGKSIHKEETRTDWRRRPLTERQIDYALDDVRYLRPMYETLAARLDQLGRTDWLAEEMEEFQRDVEQALVQERWRRVSGNSGLDRRSLAVLRELWRWREDEAQRRDVPSRRVLRDDLLVELARRKSASVKGIRAVRGLEHGHLSRHLERISECVHRALKMPENELPRGERRDIPDQVPVLGQFLATAVACACRRQQLAPSLAGSVQDVRELIAFRLGLMEGENGPPRLARGWRAEVVGRLIEDMLEGKLAIRIGDPLSDEPLTFIPAAGDTSG